MMNPPLADFSGKHWTKPVPPQTHRLVTNFDAAFEQQIFDLPQRERIPTARRITSGELLK
jgi:hypothetical protein